MGRQRRESDVSRSARRRHFTGSNRRISKNNNSKSSDISSQSEAHRGEHANEEADIQADMAISSKNVPHGMARRDKSRSLYMASALLEGRYGGL